MVIDPELWAIVRPLLWLAGLLGIVLALMVYELLGRQKAAKKLGGIAERLGVRSGGVPLPRPVYATDARINGTLDGRDVALTYIRRTRYSPPMTQLALRCGSGPRFVFGYKGMTPWLTLTRHGAWPVATSCPKARSSDAAFDDAFHAIVVVGYGNFTGPRYAQHSPSIPRALRDALMSAPADALFTSDGTIVAVLRKRHVEDDQEWRAMFELLKVAAEHPIDPRGAIAGKLGSARGSSSAFMVVMVLVSLALLLVAGSVAFWVAVPH